MKNKIITISRQYGSGGTKIAKELSERLGIPYYDQEILRKLAAQTGFDPQTIIDKGEYLKNGGWLYGIASRNRYEANPQDVIWEETEELIRDIAEKGPCIILGRCADYILKDDFELLPVFIHADIDSRMKRAVTEYGLSPDRLEKTLKEKDRMRQAYYQFYTDFTWGDAKHYTLCLDSGVIGIEKCVDIISELY